VQPSPHWHCGPQVQAAWAAVWAATFWQPQVHDAPGQVVQVQGEGCWVSFMVTLLGGSTTDVVDGMTFVATARPRQAFATSGPGVYRTGRATRPSGQRHAPGGVPLFRGARAAIRPVALLLRNPEGDVASGSKAVRHSARPIVRKPYARRSVGFLSD